jgi:hypothetical protein
MVEKYIVIKIGGMYLLDYRDNEINLTPKASKARAFPYREDGAYHLNSTLQFILSIIQSQGIFYNLYVVEINAYAL